MYCRALGSSTSTAAALAMVVLRQWVTWYAAGKGAGRWRWRRGHHPGFPHGLFPSPSLPVPGATNEGVLAACAGDPARDPAQPAPGATAPRCCSGDPRELVCPVNVDSCSQGTSAKHPRVAQLGRLPTYPG